MSDRIIAWSCGGGTQSAAIAALICRERLPRPDLAVIVDTEREKSSTWEYAESVLIPNLRAVGVELLRVPKSAFATKDLWGGEDGRTPLIPVYTTKGEGERGKLRTFCSGEWKRDVILRWLRSLGVQRCETWVGISVDEMKRMRLSRLGWAQNRYPLIEPEFGLMFRRVDCEAEVARLGWPPAPRSSCKMCPNMGDAEWLDMKTNWPEDFAYAVAFEREFQKQDPHAWLHGSCVPLDQVDFSAQRGLFDDTSCASGMCFV